VICDYSQTPSQRERQAVRLGNATKYVGCHDAPDIGSLLFPSFSLPHLTFGTLSAPFSDP
jgi:hypothetical protein